MNYKQIGQLMAIIATAITFFLAFVCFFNGDYNRATFWMACAVFNRMGWLDS